MPLTRTIFLDVVADKIQELSEISKKLTSGCWVMVDGLFRALRCLPADSLEFPEVGEDVSTELLEKLVMARSANPCVRNIKPLERHLEHSSSLNDTEIIGLLQTFQEDAFMTYGNSARLQFAFLGVLSRIISFDNTLPLNKFDLSILYKWDNFSVFNIL